MGEDLIGQEVMLKGQRSVKRGIITNVTSTSVEVTFFDEIRRYRFPEALANTLILKNKELQRKYVDISAEGRLEEFKSLYSRALNREIAFVKQTGGKHYRALDGELIAKSFSPMNVHYTYYFDTDSELKLMEGSAIKIWLPEKIINATLISCEDFSIVFQTTEELIGDLHQIEFSCESWQLLEGLRDRISDLDVKRNSIAYSLVNDGYAQINSYRSIETGQEAAQRSVDEKPITFIWGPPGTGKTTTLVKIAMGFISEGKRVLMLSYSNVSVDGAMLKMIETSDTEYEAGQIMRFGYPRVEKLLNKKKYISYQVALDKNPALRDEYDSLIALRNKTNKRSKEYGDIKKQISRIRKKLKDREAELVGEALFVATTVSKAVVDPAVYTKDFDLVLFDEASMAYVPHVVFAASLATEKFVCLGDFRQLPAIVQNPEGQTLTQDIFDYTGITKAVDEQYSHGWLVMLNYQYRMHQDIANFAGKYMYENLLKTSPQIIEERQKIADLPPMSGEPMSLLDLSGMYSVCIRTGDGSHLNVLSAFLCMRIAEICRKNKAVGIITPYAGQSKLILAMKRDLQERDASYKSVTCATVHQFQGSEKPVIIYDAVDCYRMPYPGTLLTSKKNNTADRLFNVALTRTEGKFIMVANSDYMFKKKISKDLLFTKMLKNLDKKQQKITGDNLYDELGVDEDVLPDVYVGDRDEVDSWDRYLNDLQKAQKNIHIEVPGMIDNDADAIADFVDILKECSNRDVKISIRRDSNITLPAEFKPYEEEGAYVTTPLTIIDYSVIWYGEPLCAADFISEGEIVLTAYFPCVRFEGKHTARLLKAAFEF